MWSVLTRKNAAAATIRACRMRSSLRRSRHMCKSRSDHSAKCCRFWEWTSRIITGTRCTPYLILKKSVAAVPAFVGTEKRQTENRETAGMEDYRQSRHRVGSFRVYTRREHMRSSISMPVRSRMNCPARSSVISGGFYILLRSRHTMRIPVTVCCAMCWCAADSTAVR